MTDKRQIGVYLLHNQETGQAYVGSGVLKERKKDHFYKLKTNKHKNKDLQEAFNKNPNFDFVGLETSDREEAFDQEQTTLDTYRKSDFLLNIVPNARYGPAPGRRVSEETKQKLREINTGRIPSAETRAKMAEASRGNKYSVGKKRSEETNAKIVAKQIGHIVSEETREKIRKSNTGKIRTEETLERMRQATLGRKHTEEAKNKMSLSHIGVPKTQEWKDKIGAGNKGKIISQEQRERTSLVHKGKIISPEHLACVSNKVEIKGITYNSIAEASRQLSIPIKAMYIKVKNNKDGDIKIINQRKSAQ